MYEGVSTAGKAKDEQSDSSNVKVGVHQSLVLSPLLFIIVLTVLSQELCVGSSWQLFYAHDLCLIAETGDEWMV